jgi:hypothetical protein
VVTPSAADATPATGTFTPTAPSGNNGVYDYLVNATSTPPASCVGMSFVHTWKSVEATEGVFDWSLIEADLTRAAALGKRAFLHLLWGYSPPWVEQQCPTVVVQWTAPFTGAHTTTIPITWTAAYLSRVKTAIAAFGAKYDGDPRVAHIAMALCGWQDDFQLPHPWAGWTSSAPPPNGCGPDVYTDAKLEAGCMQLIDAYAAAFVKTQKTMPYNTSGLSPNDWTVTNAVAQHAISKKFGIIFQENGLQASTSASKVAQLAALGASPGAGGYGWQQAAGGNSVAAMQAMFAAALAGKPKPLFVEVYSNDCANPQAASALAKLAAGL